MLSDVTSVLATANRDAMILAGDLNMTTQVAYAGQSQADTDAALAVFARLRAWGLRDCIEQTRATRPKLTSCSCPEGENCAHVRTFRLKNQVESRPTQLDYAFVSAPLLSKLKACHVVQNADAWRLSDHCPVVIEVDV